MLSQQKKQGFLASKKQGKKVSKKQGNKECKKVSKKQGKKEYKNAFVVFASMEVREYEMLWRHLSLRT